MKLFTMCKRTLLAAVALGVVYIGGVGSVATAGEIYAFGLGVGLDGAYKTTSLDFIIKERMAETSEVEATISLYYKEWDEKSDFGVVAFMIDFVYQWRMNIVGGLNVFIGPESSTGLCLAVYSVTETDPYFGSYETEELFFDACWGIGAQTGIEYNFNDIGAPLILSANVRPELNILKPKVIDVFSLSFHFGLTYTYK